uniref:Uncharacterized protein n=1 Tax=Eutreptiella gymnastica TaxID=73025 RepID=A0A7S1ITZ0_9EUGL
MVPLYLTVFLICINNVRQGVVGPATSTRVLLLMACALHLPANLPISFWNNFPFHTVRDVCLGPYSYYDLLLICQVWGLMLYFLFLRKEFLRNKEIQVQNLRQECQDDADWGPY